MRPATMRQSTSKLISLVSTKREADKLAKQLLKEYPAAVDAGEAERLMHQRLATLIFSAPNSGQKPLEYLDESLLANLKARDNQIDSHLYMRLKNLLTRPSNRDD